MPPSSEQLEQLTAWLTTNGIVIAIVLIALFIVYRLARPLVHRLLVKVTEAQVAALGPDRAHEGEIDKRVATIEDVLSRLVRLAVIVAFVFVFFGIFNLWPLLAGLGLVLAALTVAGQSIILDYLMGMLILVEAQYFKGDTIRVGDVQGEVEEVGFRRTVVRDVRGTVHNISNGLIRSSANLTRVYAMAMIHVYGVADEDIERAITVLDDIGRQLADDPAIKDSLFDVPGYTRTTKLSAAGATLRMAGRAQPHARVRIETEMRRRVAAGLAAAGIELVRPVGAAEGVGTGPGGRAPAD